MKEKPGSYTPSGSQIITTKAIGKRIKPFRERRIRIRGQKDGLKIPNEQEFHLQEPAVCLRRVYPRTGEVKDEL